MPRQVHWAERSRAGIISSSEVTGRPRRSVLPFGHYARHEGLDTQDDCWRCGSVGSASCRDFDSCVAVRMGEERFSISRHLRPRHVWVSLVGAAGGIAPGRGIILPLEQESHGTCQAGLTITVQRTGTSRRAEWPCSRRRWLDPVDDLCVSRHCAMGIFIATSWYPSSSLYSDWLAMVAVVSALSCSVASLQRLRMAVLGQLLVVFGGPLLFIAVLSSELGMFVLKDGRQYGFPLWARAYPNASDFLATYIALGASYLIARKATRMPLRAVRIVGWIEVTVFAALVVFELFLLGRRIGVG